MRPFPRLLNRRALQALRTRSQILLPTIQRRTLVRAPRPGEGPLMERRPDRELPSVESVTFRWTRTLPVFVLIIAVSSVALFNYQKSTSPVVGATLYALRTSRKAREYLGDEIYFARQIPWIRGEMNQLHGRIDIHFGVKGSRNQGEMRFVSYRRGAKAMFETQEWSLETKDGRKIDLLDGEDPFKGIAGLGMDEEEKEQATRGFRQQLK